LPQDALRFYRSMITRHVDAIATGGYDPALEPVFGNVRTMKEPGALPVGS
jgi:hypothetical protein